MTKPKKIKIYKPEEVYQTLKERDPDLWVDLALSEIAVSDVGSVRVRGKFVKGFPANPGGRAKLKEEPKSTNLTKAEIDKFGADAKKALEHLLATASSRHEVKEISKILITYQSPKLANIESRSFQQQSIEIKWADPATNLIDITPEEYAEQLKALQDMQTLGDDSAKTDLNEAVGVLEDDSEGEVPDED